MPGETVTKLEPTGITATPLASVTYPWQFFTLTKPEPLFDMGVPT